MSEIRLTKVAVDEVAPNRRRGGDIRVLLSPKTVGSTSGFMGVAYLQPGEHFVEHYHPYSEEFMYVVRGTVVARVDGGQEIVLRPGEGMMVPKTVKHRVENRGDEEACMVFHASPLAPRPDLGHVDTEQSATEHAGHARPAGDAAAGSPR
ncbi:cupin domain-containing protein [Sphaerisporangium sp. TRM90804]|uniref:cupin domain-containing protein n=1 Tax=Sphaerisporangium sp. TRM90804 TaxID=3031113 RepID=UPI002446DCE6|nr:cupin domain-containing protein [Sphaerisporangium sp. TRM90804]MDH2426174.1 cupin domain-containing protein [Sphaerisporangium sp. TRM90804]